MIVDCPKCGRVYYPGEEAPRCCPGCAQLIPTRNVAEWEVNRIRERLAKEPWYHEGMLLSDLAAYPEGRELIGWLPLTNWIRSGYRRQIRLRDSASADALIPGHEAHELDPGVREALMALIQRVRSGEVFPAVFDARPQWDRDGYEVTHPRIAGISIAVSGWALRVLFEEVSE